jgi:hypothetical protein
LNNNTATAVVRVDGRSWVHDAEAFMKATQATDSDFYRQAEGTTEESYKNIWLPTLRRQQVRQASGPRTAGLRPIQSAVLQHACF